MSVSQNKPVEVEAAKRDGSKNPRQLRAAGLIPATIYSKGTDSVSVQVEARTFSYYFLNGRRVFQLKGVDQAVRARSLQISPLTQEVISIEFLALSKAEVQEAIDEVSKIREAREAAAAAQSAEMAKKKMAAEPTAEEAAAAAAAAGAVPATTAAPEAAPAP